MLVQTKITSAGGSLLKKGLPLLSILHKNAGGISDKSEDRNPELWMLLRQTPEYTLAACTAAGEVAFGDWLEAVQITKIREEELCASWL